MKDNSECGTTARCRERAGQPGQPGQPSQPGQLEIDRRAILRVGAAGSAMLVTLPFACSPGGNAPPSGPVAAGNVSTVTVGSLKVIDNTVLGRDAGGLYAMSAVCTHQGCFVAAPGTTAAGLDCPCHGSRFDQNGAVTNGPASSPLQHYQVDVATGGAITIQGAIVVASTARTPLP